MTLRAGILAAGLAFGLIAMLALPIAQRTRQLSSRAVFGWLVCLAIYATMLAAFAQAQ